MERIIGDSVTIGIPVFNEEKYISDTITSAINQSYENLEILISDNCSSDNNFKIIKEIAANHDNITLIRQEKNIGASQNFNYLVENANTEFFCWLSGHDLLHKDFIFSAVNVFKEYPDLVLVYPQSEYIDEKGKLMNIKSYSKIDTTTLDCVQGPLKVANNLIFGTPIHGLFKTRFLKENRFKSIIGGDFILLYNASLSGKIFELPFVYHHLREVRKETATEIYRRYNEFGLKTRYSNPCTEMCKEYLNCTIFSKKIRLVPKIKLLLELAVVLKRRYNSPYFHNSIRIYSFIKRIKRKIV